MAGSLRRAARAYRANMSNEEKGLVSDFFKSLDANGDGKISIRELLESSKENGSWKSEEYPYVSGFFEALDLDGDGYWDYDDAVTCYYVFKTMRLSFCDGCGKFLSENYFTCTHCFDQKSFDLCCDCYQNRRFQHHNDAVFCDNFELLNRFRQGVETSSSTKPSTQAQQYQEEVQQCRQRVQQYEQREQLRKAQERVQQYEQQEQLRKAQERVQQYEQREQLRKAHSSKGETAKTIVDILNLGVGFLQLLSPDSS